MKKTFNPCYPTHTAYVSNNPAIFSLLHKRSLAIMPNRKPYFKQQSELKEYDNMNHFKSERYDNGLSFYTDEFTYDFSMTFCGLYYRCIDYLSEKEVTISKKP